MTLAAQQEQGPKFQPQYRQKRREREKEKEREREFNIRSDCSSSMTFTMQKEAAVLTSARAGK
jgi:hypothetical protein